MATRPDPAGVDVDAGSAEGGAAWPGARSAGAGAPSPGAGPDGVVESGAAMVAVRSWAARLPAAASLAPATREMVPARTGGRSLRRAAPVDSLPPCRESPSST